MLAVFDNTVDPPEFKQTIELTAGGHGWVYFSRDGNYCIPNTPDIIDVNTKEIVYTLKDETGREVSGSKFFEAHFNGDELVWVSSQFGLGFAPLDTGNVSVENQDLLNSGNFRDLVMGVSEAYVYTVDGKLVKEVLNNISNPDQLKYGLPEGLYTVMLKKGNKLVQHKMMVMH